MATVHAQRQYSRRRSRRSPGQPQESIFPSVSQPTSDVERVLALQRLIGNHATQQMLQRDTKTTREVRIGGMRGGIESKGGVSALPWNAVKKEEGNWKETAWDSAGEGAETLSTFKDELSMALNNFSSENQTVAFDGILRDWLKDQGLPPNTSLNDLSTDQVSDLEQKEIEKGGLSVISKDSDQRADLGIGAGAAGTVALGAGAFASFVSMAAAFSKLRGSTGKVEKIMAGLELGGQGAKTLALAGQTASSAGSTIASGVASTGNDVASNASNVMSGITNSFGGLTPVLDMFLSSVNLVKIVMSFKGSTRREKKGLAADAGLEALSAAKAFLATARSTISAVHTFMDIASAASNLTSVIPFLGPAINICVQFIDVVMQIIELVRHAVRVHKGRIRAKAMRIKKEATTAGSDDWLLFEKLQEVNSKRMKRAIRPMVAASVSAVADVVSVGGSLLNIIGTATAPAYGAGVAIMAVGYGLSAGSGLVKLGAGASKPIAAGIRGGKQKARNFAANPNAKRFKKTRAFMDRNLVNTDKTSEKKHARDVKTVERLFNVIAGLPQPYTDPLKDKYTSAYDLLKASGVDRQALFRLNNQPEKQLEMLVAAIKKRE